MWHEGELALQDSAGVRRLMEHEGALIRDHLIEQHRLFFPLLPSVVIGAVDAQGDVWATMREGRPGFVAACGDRALEICTAADASDPAETGLSEGGAIGVLGIELNTRRRNRVNGSISRREASRLLVAVEQSFGNCPQYIQLRNVAFSRDPCSQRATAAPESRALTDVHRAMIAAADTFFVASYVDREAHRQVDVSHRGGKPGFVRIEADGSLTIPDFAGNLYFNTLGNIFINGRAGVCFPDFEAGALLQITGKAEVVLDSPEIGFFKGAERLWRLVPERIVLRRNALALRWSKVEGGASPNSTMTGNWDDVSRLSLAAAKASRWRPLRVTQRVEESASISSFYLHPADSRPLPRHEAGQYLPIQLRLDEGSPVMRNYTISVAPSDNCYRLSIKRDGAASSFIHDNFRVGEVVDAKLPAGDFRLRRRSKRPSVLIAAGVGITPMIAMLRHRLFERKAAQSPGQTWLFHGARSTQERAFDRELALMAGEGRDWLRIVRTLSNVRGATQARDYEFAGRLDAALVAKCLPSLECDFYLCGPPGFMQDIYDGLHALGVPDGRIFAEAFGPAGLRRKWPRRRALTPQSTEAVTVRFAKSGVEAVWEPGSGTLLELAERIGLAPDHYCRTGKCGTCAVLVTGGMVTYAGEPEFDVRGRKCLLCRAVPAEGAWGPDGCLSIEA